MSTPERFHGLDAARAFALLLGIALHATMSFFLVIPAQDSSRSTTLAVAFYVIHIFRMSVFYLIAGFFAHLLLERRGTRAFVRDRAKRIVVPMTAGWLLLAPPTIAAVLWGLSRTFPNADPAGAVAPQGFPLTHLWFLYYLCIFYILALVMRTAIDAKPVDAIFRLAVAKSVAPIALAIPTVAVLHLDPSWPVWFGIQTPDTGLTPKLPALVAYGTAFAAGWLLHRQSTLLEVLGRQWRTNLVIAIALTVACLSIVGLTPDVIAPTALEGGAAMRLAYAAGYSLAIWYWTFGLIGAAVRFCSAASAPIRYLSDASYFFYLAHLPIVFALQVLLMDVPLHWSLKFPLIVAITLGVLLAAYHSLVRGRFIGELLNGRRDRKSNALPVESTIAGLDNVTKRYGKTIALDGVSLRVAPGELLAVLGPNGAGKSTAIGLWLGTLQPDDGVARVMGGSPLDVHSRLGTGVMMQEVALAPALTAREHVALAASYYRDPLPVDEVLALTNIEAFADQRYGKLSAGQKRQVQFAAAICGRPRLLFLDEPTVGLDVGAREAMWRNIRRLVAGGCSIVLTTHYLEEAEALADRVAVLARGRVIADGSVDEMRAIVTRKRISCASAIAIDEIKHWPGVVDVARDAQVVHVTASDAEGVVRRLLAADERLSHLEVKQATLAEAFTELTKEAA